MNITIPNIKDSRLVLIDMQEKLSKVICKIEPIIERQEVMIKGANTLGLDIIVCEQYPQGLGHTIEPIKNLLSKDVPIIEKSSFSAFGEPRFLEKLNSKPKKNLIFCGIEAHVCVMQSMIDALNANYNVILLADAISSRKCSDVDLAIKHAQSLGITVLSVEALLLMLVKDSKHANFKEISKLIR